MEKFIDNIPHYETEEQYMKRKYHIKLIQDKCVHDMESFVSLNKAICKKCYKVFKISDTI